MFKRILSFFCFFLMFLATLTGPTIALAEDLIVYGWPQAAGLDFRSLPATWLGDDAIIGRLACPSIVRLEANHGRNAPALLKTSPKVENYGIKEIWTLTLRPGLRWWSGVAVDAESLAAWLKANLANIVKERLGDELQSDVMISVEDGYTVKISWPKSPGFGPFVLSGVSLYRTIQGGFECAGLYSATPIPGGVELTLGKGYRARFSKIRVLSGVKSDEPGKKSIKFFLAGTSAKVTPTTIRPESCLSKLDVPMVTALIWNPLSPLASKPELREALTHATPRGEILRTAAADVGSLVSAPILRHHPGYNSKLLVKPFNLDTASKALDRAGFKRQHIGMPRSQDQGKPLRLRIVRMGGRQDLLEKMIGDSYASLGVNTQFEDSGNGGATFDAALVSVVIPGNSQDIRSMTHSRAFAGKNTHPLPFTPVTDRELDGLMDSYARSLTVDAVANFDALRKVHQKWYDLEPWTVLIAHQYCVDANGMTLPKHLNSLDPDWFRSLVIGS